MDKFIIQQPNKRSNNSESSNIGSASSSTSHEEVVASFSSSAKKQKAPKNTKKLYLVAGTGTGESTVRGWSTEYDEDNDVMYCSRC